MPSIAAHVERDIIAQWTPDKRAMLTARYANRRNRLCYCRNTWHSVSLLLSRWQRNVSISLSDTNEGAPQRRGAMNWRIACPKRLRPHYDGGKVYLFGAVRLSANVFPLRKCLASIKIDKGCNCRHYTIVSHYQQKLNTIHCHAHVRVQLGIYLD